MLHKKILILTSNPNDNVKLRADREIKEIKEKIERSKNRDRFEIIPELAVQPDDLIPLLQEKEPQIVHFCGHGKEGGLVFENESGNSQSVEVSTLGRLFEQFKDTVECVFLNACHSEDQAKAIHTHIQYVIGMKGDITDDAAIQFAANFYATLITERSYREAFNFGRIALELQGIQSDLLPIFLEKPTIPPRKSLDLPDSLHYNSVINAFKNGEVIPFLGSGINLDDGQPSNERISNIELVDYLAQDLELANNYQYLQGSPCSVCLVSNENLPADCPLRKTLLEGAAIACPEHEQALAVAQLKLQCLAQHIAFESSLHNVYQKLDRLFRERSHTNKFHKFFATLPGEMLKKEFPLPYKLLVTTNYDNMLESAFVKNNQLFDLLSYVAETDGENTQGRFRYTPSGEESRLITSDQVVLHGNRPLILKLYGVTNNFVITEDQHINYLVNQEIERAFPKDILQILRSSNILFMGYSPSDVNLRIIVNRLWGKKLLGQKSWMIHQSRIGSLDKGFWSGRNVELLDSDLERYRLELAKQIEALEKRSLYNHWR